MRNTAEGSRTAIKEPFHGAISTPTSERPLVETDACLRQQAPFQNPSSRVQTNVRGECDRTHDSQPNSRLIVQQTRASPLSKHSTERRNISLSPETIANDIKRVYNRCRARTSNPRRAIRTRRHRVDHRGQPSAESSRRMNEGGGGVLRSFSEPGVICLPQ